MLLDGKGWQGQDKKTRPFELYSEPGTSPAISFNYHRHKKRQLPSTRVLQQAARKVHIVGTSYTALIGAAIPVWCLALRVRRE